MNVRRSCLAILVTVFLSGLALSLFAAEIYPKASRRKGDLDAAKLVSILDEVLREEQQLLQAVEEIKGELAVVKTRASITTGFGFTTSGDACP